MKQFKDFGIVADVKAFNGDKIKVSKILNKEVLVERYKIEPSTKFEGKDRLCLQLMVDGEKRIAFSSSDTLMNMIRKVPESHFPFHTTIKVVNEHHEFT